MATRMQQRRGTAAQWTSANPVLAAGEIGFETDTNKFKIGNGSTAWASLSYFVDGSAIVDGAPELLNTLNEVAAALGDDPSFFTTVANNLANHESDTTNIHGIANTALLATKSYADEAAANAAASVVDSAPELLNTLNELAQALNDDADFSVTVSNSFASVQTSLYSHGNSIATQSNAISDLQGNVISIANNLATTDSNLNTASNAIDGLSNSLSLATSDIGVLQGNVISLSNGLSDAENSINALSNAISSNLESTNTAINALANAVASDLANSISEHNNATINVHGIANTATIVYTSDARLSDERVPTDGSVAEGKIASSAVTNGKIATDAVDGTKIADDSIAAEHIADEVITNAHISNTAAIAQSKISGLTTDLGNKQDKVTDVSDTEIGYLANVTSDIQSQIDGKASLSGATFTGSVEIDQNLTVDGDFIVNGSNVLVSATQIQIEDTLLQLGHTNAANTTDLGMVVSYNDGTQKHAGIVKDVTDGKWKLFDGVTTEPATTVDFSQGALDTLAVGALEAANVITATSGVAFSDGTQTKEGVPSQTTIISKSASYTLSSLTERDDLIEVDSASATTITIPANSSVAYPVGTSIDILQVGSGQVTIAGDTGVTVNATPGLKLRAQWSSATLFKRATDTWVVFGDLTA
jgi:archaellum component FlaC